MSEPMTDAELQAILERIEKPSDTREGYSDTRHAFEDRYALFAALTASREQYRRLADAVNENDSECLPGCDSYAHDENCPNISTAATLEKQQAEIERLRGEVANECASKIALGVAAAGIHDKDVQRIAALEAEIAMKQRTIKHAQGTIATLETEIGDSEAELAAKDARIRELEARFNKLNKMQPVEIDTADYEKRIEEMEKGLRRWTD